MSKPHRASIRPSRPRAEAMERRTLLTGYYPAVADYDGDGVADVASFRYVSDDAGTQLMSRNAVLIQPSSTGFPTGYELGYSATDRPVVGDFDGDGKADPAVYGFLDGQKFGNLYYGTPPAGTPAPFPAGAGRFAYIPSSGVYPADGSATSVNGTQDTDSARMVVVNLGSAGDLPAVADYDGDGKADFAVYDPAQAQFLFYPSSTFNPAANPAAPGNGPRVVPLGRPGDVPASADYLGLGHAQFAAYDAATGTFFVQSAAGTVDTVQLGGPGDVPTPGDFQGLGRADFAVYDPTAGRFLDRPGDGSAPRYVPIGRPGDIPTVARFADGRDNFATYTPATQQFQYVSPAGGVATRALPDPDAIPIERTDSGAAFVHQQYAAATGNPTVAFFGDSITYRWPIVASGIWSSWMGRFDPLELGVSGETSQNLLWRLANGELDHIRPQVIVVETGTNDIPDRSATQVADTIRTILDLVHAKVPGAAVLLLGITPRGGVSTTDQVFDLKSEAEVQAFNQVDLPALATPFAARGTAASPTGAYSLDLRAGLSADPTDPNNYFANPALYSDPVHPTDIGYARIASALATPLRLLLGRQLVPGDYDGDGSTDLGVYAQDAGTLVLRASATGGVVGMPLGVAGAGRSTPVVGDFDGDGKADPAVYVADNGSFVVTASATGLTTTIPFGSAGEGASIPAVGDYDGDGKADLAVYLPAYGVFAVRNSATGTGSVVPFGAAGSGQAIPAPGDYDGDGKTDFAVYIPQYAVFAYRPSSGGADVLTPFGAAGSGQAIPAPGDYDGDGKTDLALLLPSFGVFAVRSSSRGTDAFRAVPGATAGVAATLIPAPGDYDGDGKTDLGTYNPATGTFALALSTSGIDLNIPYIPAATGPATPVTALDVATPSTLIPAAAAPPSTDNPPTTIAPPITVTPPTTIAPPPQTPATPNPPANVDKPTTPQDGGGTPTPPAVRPSPTVSVGPRKFWRLAFHPGLHARRGKNGGFR